MVAEELFKNVKKVIFKVSYNTSRGRSRNSNLRIRGAGAESNISA
jgi:hypothetical protein